MTTLPAARFLPLLLLLWPVWASAAAPARPDLVVFLTDD